MKTRTWAPGIVVTLLVTACGLAPSSAGESGPIATDGTSVGLPTPASTGTASAVPSATATSSAGTLPIDGFVSVAAEGLNMREEPGLDAQLVRELIADCQEPCPPLRLGEGTLYLELYLLDGPVEADGYAWYLAATVTESAHYAEYIGWVAAGDAGGNWLEPRDPECPQAPLEIGDISLGGGFSRFDAIACFGGQEVTVRGWYVDLPADAEDPGDCAAEPAWLVCGYGYHMLRPEPSEWYGDANNLQTKVDPASGVQMPPRGSWVEITGMWDHPAAQGCLSEGQASPGLTLICRMEFVVTAGRLAEQP